MLRLTSKKKPAAHKHKKGIRNIIFSAVDPHLPPDLTLLVLEYSWPPWYAPNIVFSLIDQSLPFLLVLQCSWSQTRSLRTMEAENNCLHALCPDLFHCWFGSTRRYTCIYRSLAVAPEECTNEYSTRYAKCRMTMSLLPWHSGNNCFLPNPRRSCAFTRKFYVVVDTYFFFSFTSGPGARSPPSTPNRTRRLGMKLSRSCNAEEE
jgi:hypothetical protein